MAELYQLRGRVGRSNRRRMRISSRRRFRCWDRTTLQRLQALQEFTELGSGLNLAMRDLEIRGAGNLLGSEQSGFIEAMGFETYTRLLDEAVHELKREEFARALSGCFATRPAGPAGRCGGGDRGLNPREYIPSEAERLTIYRRLHALTRAISWKRSATNCVTGSGGSPLQVEGLFGRDPYEAAGGSDRVPEGASGQPTVWRSHFPPQTDTEFYESRQGSSVL